LTRKIKKAIRNKQEDQTEEMKR